MKNLSRERGSLFQEEDEELREGESLAMICSCLILVWKMRVTFTQPNPKP